MSEYEQRKFINLVHTMKYAIFIFMNLPKATLPIITRYSLLVAAAKNCLILEPVSQKITFPN